MLPERSAIATSRNASATTNMVERLEVSLGVQNIERTRGGGHRSVYSLDIEELSIWNTYIHIQKSPEVLLQGPSIAIHLCRALHADFMNIMNDHLNRITETEAQPEDRITFLSTTAEICMIILYMTIKYSFFFAFV
jgi:hypothetical protein